MQIYNSTGLSFISSKLCVSRILSPSPLKITASSFPEETAEEHSKPFRKHF